MYDSDFHNPPVLIATGMGEPAGIDVNRIDNVLAVPSFADNSVAFIQLPAIYLNAEFSSDVTTGHAPFTVQFNDISTSNPGVNSWKWDFDNDGVVDSDEQYPVWTYNNPGRYSVKLSIESDSLSKEIVYENYIHIFNGESSVEFPVAGSYVRVEPSESITMESEWTLEGWFKPTSLNGKIIVDKGTVNLFTNRSSSTLYRKNSLGIKLTKEDGSTVRFSTSDSSLTSDTWNHFALSYSYSSSLLKVYINGEEEPITIADSVLFDQPLKTNGDSPLIIGNNPLYKRGLIGCIDELRIWKAARTGEDIKLNMEEYLTGGESGLSAYWKMNEGNGSELIDLTGNNNNGVLTESNYSDGIDFSVFTSNERYAVESEIVPEKFGLMQNYPNPFNPETTIEFLLPVRSHVQLSVYNLSGELITTLVNRDFKAGSNRVVWNGRNNRGGVVPSGIYFYRIMTPAFSEIRKMVLLR
jgi:PKD repeat protein